jgi:hypothetical protein
MTMTTISDRRFNPVFWLMWLLPGSAVVAGLTTLAIALEDADRALPADYHWEGEHLDQDFARARVAATLGIEVTLSVQGGSCQASTLALPDDPAALDLLLTHGSNAGFDRRVRLARVSAGEYRAACAPLEPGRWRVALDDDSHRWAIRGNAVDAINRLSLRARNPAGGGP